MIIETVQLLYEDAAIQEDARTMTVPAVITREGVHNRKFKPFAALQSSVPSFEGAPVNFTHPGIPIKEQSGVPGVIGVLRNVRARTRPRDLHAMVVFDKAKAPSEFLFAVRQGQMREGSIGFRAAEIPSHGVFKGKPYDMVQVAIRGDHYAVGIPVGACSVADGCGLLQDEETCTVLKPVDIDGIKMVKLTDMQGYIKNNLFPRITAELPPEIRERILTPEELALSGVEDMSAEELIKLSKENQKLTDTMEKMNETMQANAEAIKGFNEAKTKREADLKAANDKLKPFEEKEKTDAKALHDAAVLEILTVKKLEDTPENRAVYKDWAAPQLATLKAEISGTPAAGVDRSGRAPPNSNTSAGGGTVDGYKPSDQIMGKEFTIGDLSGKGPPTGRTGIQGAEKNPRL